MSLPAVLYVALALLVPLVVLVIYSFWASSNGFIIHRLTLGNYERVFSQGIYLKLLLRTFWFVGLAAVLTVLLTLPFAHFVATKVPPRRRVYWVLVAMIPFFTSYLIRVFAWMNFYGDNGLINSALMQIHLTSQPLGFLSFTRWDVLITFVYLLFPLSFLSSYIAIERVNPAFAEAAADLGARPWRSTLR